MPEGLGRLSGPDEIRTYFGEGMVAFDFEVEEQVEEIEVNNTWTITPPMLSRL